MRNASTKQTTEKKSSSQRQKKARRIAPSAAAKPRITNKMLSESVRRAFFANGGELATRYGITLEHVLAHIEAAEEFAKERSDASRELHLSRIPHMLEDLVIATACCHGVTLAWKECQNMNAHLLTRACELRLDEIDAILFVRRFWEELEARSRGTLTSAGPRIQDYLGTRPLRTWLADRLLGRLEGMMRTGSLNSPARRPEFEGSTASLRITDYPVG